MGTTELRGVLALAALVVAAACSKKADGPGRLSLKEADAALTSAGFKAGELKDTDPLRFSARKCREGTLEGVETVLCEYGSADAAKLGKSAGEDWVAQATTGAVLINGLTLIAVADRSRADPNGKIIHRLTQAFAQAH